MVGVHVLLEHALNVGLELALAAAVHVLHHLAHLTQWQRLGRQIRHLEIIHFCFNIFTVSHISSILSNYFLKLIGRLKRLF